jgi:outer membrane protein OmpA-like peptidoglycan-associated protein
MERLRILVVAVAAAVLAGCASTPGGSGRGTGPGEAAGPTAAPRPTLAQEQRRLADLFSGTPVVFAMQKDGSLRVSVPLHFSFDPGRYAVKPPLGAVLDRVARSQRTAGTHFVVTAPTDPKAKGLMLGTERASSTRDYLVARGVDATRLSIAAAGGGDVIIVVAEAAPH